MANPLVRLGVKAAVKGGKKLAKKIKTRANSTNNINTGPVDRAIKRVSAINKENKHLLKNLEKGNVYKEPSFSGPKRMKDYKKSIMKGESLKNKLGFKRLHKKMGIK